MVLNTRVRLKQVVRTNSTKSSDDNTIEIIKNKTNLNQMAADTKLLVVVVGGAI